MHFSKKLLPTALALLFVLPFLGGAMAAPKAKPFPKPPVTTQDNPVKGGG